MDSTQEKQVTVYKGRQFIYLSEVVLIGETKVGKTHLLHQFILFYSTSPKICKPTLVVEFASKLIEVNSKNIKAQIWDTAGEERYQSITHAYFRKAAGAIYVYDITNELTIENVQKRVQEFRNTAEPGAVVMLLGNKLDLVETDPNTRKIAIDYAQNIAFSNGMLFKEISAFSNRDVQECFLSLIECQKNLYYLFLLEIETIAKFPTQD